MSCNQPMLRLTRLENREVPTTLNLFDESFYLRRYPDVATAVSTGRFTAEEHFRRVGDKEGRAGNPIFESADYLNRYSDVRFAVNNGRITSFLHFERHGQFERRDPSNAFRTGDYLGFYGDVNSAVNAGRITAFEHFYKSGLHESRLPFREFSQTDYLEDYLDVKAAVVAGQTNAVAHYEFYGRHEGRTPHTLAMAPMALLSGQTAQMAGQSMHNDDRQVYSFTPTATGRLSVSVTFSSEIPLTGDIPRARVENALNTWQLFQRVSYDGNTLTLGLAPQEVTANVPLFLRITGAAGMAPDFTVEMSLN